jgi:hypothetical protein
MNPIKFPGSTILGAPKNWDAERDGECIGLPVAITTMPNGMAQYTSVWKFTDEERARIATGENVAISCFSVQVPIMLSVESVDGEVVPFGTDEETKAVTPAVLLETVTSVMQDRPTQAERAIRDRKLVPWFVSKVQERLAQQGFARCNRSIIDEIINALLDQPSPASSQ